MHFPTIFIAFCLGLSSQTPPKQQPTENKGMPPRASVADYQAHEKAGNITIAADFEAHSIATPESTFTTDDYIAVEVAFYGPPGAHTEISPDQFSLRINGKKPLPGQPYGMVLGSAKDPDWQPPESSPSKSKTSLNSGGSGSDNSGPPPPVHVPIEVQHAMAVKIQKAALPEGDRVLPQAGMIFFRYSGNGKSIHSVELDYSGPAGKTTLDLQR
ncbi:MAG TPA: hypothetical protein VKB88_07785 [Bryobacteraceae bacterium]|nr:hypothetical protein [Bryobacteraceae bacterium]